MKHRVKITITLLLASLLSFDATAGAVRSETPSENQLRRMGVLFVAPQAMVGASCGSAGIPISIGGNAQEILANIPQEARDKFEAQYPKVEAERAVYEAQSAKHDIPWVLFAGLHYREGGNNPDQTPLNGQPYGETNVDDNGFISTPDQAYEIATRLIRGHGKTYGVENISNSIPLSVQDIAKIGIGYNRGSLYKRAFGEEEGPWHSPYVANFMDEQRINMKFEGPSVNNVEIEPRLAGESDSNLGLVPFVLLLYEKVGSDLTQVAGAPNNVFSSDTSSPCNIRPNSAIGTNLGSVVYYSQKDPQWAQHAYPYPENPDNAEDRTVATSGCGPTSMAMVIATLTGDKTITPDKIADENLAGGYRNANGTVWAAFTNVLPRYGLKVEQIDNTDTDRLATALRGGALAIGSFGPGVFTTGGHIIVIRAVTDEGNFLVADPNDKLPGDPEYQRKSLTEWSPSIIASESKSGGMFLITKE